MNKKQIVEKDPVIEGEKDLVELFLNFTPEVGHETTKIAVSLSVRLVFGTNVSCTRRG